jgi:hypothetical protein
MPYKKYSKKQKALAAIVPPKTKITKEDLDVLRRKKTKRNMTPTAKEKAVKHLENNMKKKRK